MKLYNIWCAQHWYTPNVTTYAGNHDEQVSTVDIEYAK